jgi:hypothetical protein
MLARNRIRTLLIAASYLLAVSASALFHHHHDCDHDESHRPGVAASHCEGQDECSVCQFLAQKPAPMAEVAPADLGTLVQELAASSPESATCGVFNAWQSRAPPAFA